MQNLRDELQQRLQKVFEGGGKKAVAKQAEKGKLTARQRIDYLIDKGSAFVEIG